MGNKKTGDLEKIYTSQGLIQYLDELFNTWCNIDDYDEILEPAAGSGNILDYFKNKYPNKKVLAYDIFNETQREDIIETDFLKYKGLEYNDRRITIMNPPFTKATSFIKKSLEVSKFVIAITGNSTFLNLDYDAMDVKEIQLINKQPFEGTDKTYNVAILIIEKK
jgi:hypothetical protein